jgi:hypothetical protein
VTHGDIKFYFGIGNNHVVKLDKELHEDEIEGV